MNNSDPSGMISTQQFWADTCSLGLFDSYIAVACDLFSQGLPGLSTLECEFGNASPNTPCPGNANRGVIQAQGTTGQATSNKGRKWSKSVSWTQGNPPTLQDGLAMATQLAGMLTPREYNQRRIAFKKLIGFMVYCSETYDGGCGPVNLHWKDPGNHPAQRVDIQIYTGVAFIPVLAQGSEMSYNSGSECSTGVASVLV